jgi:cell division protein ZipA
LGELRLILLGIGLVLLAAIWWWTARGSGQARGAAELREKVGRSEAEPVPRAPPASDLSPAPEGREWSVSPLEPLSITTAEYDDVPILDLPMMVEPAARSSEPPMLEPLEPLEFAPSTPPMRPAPPIVSARSAPHPTPPAAETRTDDSDRFAPVPPRNPNASEKQKIVSVRVCALGDARWSGARLMAALQAQGLAYGKYQVFHRKHTDGRSLFFVASLVEPGTFDDALMPEQEFRGITLFAVLPGPAEAVQTFDALLATARGLAEGLTGMVQDSKGQPLSPQRAAGMRDEVAHFQAQLT